MRRQKADTVLDPTGLAHQPRAIVSNLCRSQALARDVNPGLCSPSRRSETLDELAGNGAFPHDVATSEVARDLMRAEPASRGDLNHRPIDGEFGCWGGMAVAFLADDGETKRVVGWADGDGAAQDDRGGGGGGGSHG